MTLNRDLDRLLDVWMDDGPTALPDGAFDAAMAGLRRTAHRRAAGRAASRNPTASTRLLAAAALLVALAALGVAALPGNPMVGPAQPTPTVTPTESSPAAEFSCVAGRCLGLLTPGVHATTVFEVPFTYSVPDGWANLVDIDGMYQLGEFPWPPSEDYADMALGLGVLSDPLPATQEHCQAQADPDVGQSAADLIAWLADLPSVLASEPQPVTLAGFDALAIDLTLAPGETAPCLDYASLFVAHGDVLIPHWVALPPSYYVRLLAFDHPAGHTVVVATSAGTGRDPSQMFGAAPEIVASIEFAP